jgi:hypothetical protein
MPLRLVLPIPAQGGSEVGKQFVDVIETYNPVKITLLKHGGLEQEGEEAPNWLMKAIEESEITRQIEIETVKILPMDPAEYRWDEENFFSTHFEPVSGPNEGGIENVFLTGVGSGWLTYFMTSLAVSSGADILISTPEDAENVRHMTRISFVKEGLQGYRKYLPEKSIKQTPIKKFSIQRNLMIRLLLGADGLQDSYGLCGPRYLPNSAGGVSKSMQPMVEDGLVIASQDEGGMTLYSLTPAGIVCALECRKHHLSKLGSEYFDGPPKIDTKEDDKLSGVVMSTRSTNPNVPLRSDEISNDLNRIGGIPQLDEISAIICNLTKNRESRIEVINNLISNQPNIHELVRSRGWNSDVALLSICGPDWDPEENFRSTLRFLMGLNNQAKWRIDITRLTPQERVVVTICGYLLGIDSFYTMKKVENLPSSKSFMALPKHSIWRIIGDYEAGLFKSDVVSLVRAIQSPDDPLDKESFNRLLDKQVNSLPRIDSTLTKHGIFKRLDSGKSWILTEEGKALWNYLKGK